MAQLNCKWALALVSLSMLAEVRFSGRVVDPSGAAITAADVTVTNRSTGARIVLPVSATGTYEAAGLSRGEYDVQVSAPGFGLRRRSIRLTGATETIDWTLEPATLAQQIEVTAGQLLGDPLDADRLPGSYSLISAAMLTESRVFGVDEALRKAPGVHTRAEEGFNLRPNIGIRGLNPTRSTKVLLLEDGVPLSYAPYGDNASYFHPPVDRFQEIEILKGAGQILYGPMTVGGVINYITPSIPSQNSGALTLTGGNLDYLNAHLQYGFNWKKTGVLVDAVRKQGEGARENLRHGIADFNTKVLHQLTPNQTLAGRFSFFDEGSRVTYSGLREAEWLLNPRGNPFVNDRFDTYRWSASAVHTWVAKPDFVVTTTGYGSVFHRDWWRQSSNSAQRPNDAGDPLCGGMANLLTTCGNEGRLRSYWTWGIAPQARTGHRLFGRRNEIDFGGRYHDELQERIQANGTLPQSRSGLIVENNQRRARATSAFLQDRYVWGKLTLSGGVRLEHVRYQRLNRLGGTTIGGVRGNTALTQWIPGFGLSYSATSRITFFTGIHRGFAPPRVEDIINNTTGQAIELDPELSWNYEAGVRARLARETMFEATYFRMDFQNQIIPASVAGGIGATLTNAGETLHQGFELSGRWTKRNLGGSRHGVAVHGAFTYLPQAEFAGRRFSTVGGFTNRLITGNRLPYAPEYLSTASIHYLHASGANLLVEGVYTGRQFGDDLNTVGGTPDGQRGLIPSNLLWNATANFPVEAWRTTFFVTTKNMLDRLYIVDRSRGLLPGMPRQVQAGLRFTF